MDKKKIKRIEGRLDFYTRLRDKLYAAYEALVEGGAQSYVIDDRELTRLDIGDLWKQIEECEEKIEELEALLAGASARKAVAVVPRDR